MVTLRTILLHCIFFFFLFSAHANKNEKVKVAPFFQSHMVLQQNQAINIWGTAGANERIEVELDGNIKVITANEEGDWSVVFPKRKASFNPVELRVNNQLFTDILIGELWLCAGQSNMAFPLFKSDYPDWENNCSNTNLRLLRMENIRAVAKEGYTKEELARCNPNDFFRGNWSQSNPGSARNFSAVAWIMGNKLSRELNVPVGLIQVAVGGSAMNNWLPPHILKKHPLTEGLYKTDWLENEEVFVNHRKRAKAAFQHVLKEGEPFIPGEMAYRWMCEPGFLFEAGIAPLKGLNFKGIVWYQGESDAYSDKVAYDAKELFGQLIHSWSNHFEKKELPFVFVQLPAYKSAPWPIMREVQRMADKNIPNTSMVVTIDLGLKENIHPSDKTPIGNRLANMALKDVYKQDDLAGFPSLKKIKVKNSKLILHFDNCENGWQHLVNEITGFEIKNKDGKYYPAIAEITGETTIVLTSGATSPEGVRYGWAAFPEPALKLFNKAGLPLGPFVVYLNGNSDLQNQ
uniref:sialate O-acetylesterase n=1 Tax=uncultured Draconibacterium sp. TaxID=1573823 RepID=UPI00321757F1